MAIVSIKVMFEFELIVKILFKLQQLDISQLTRNIYLDNVSIVIKLKAILQN